MKNFLSVVYIKTNPLSEERICIGLFCGGGGRLFFNFSENKLKHVANLVSKEVALSLKADLKKLKKDVEDTNTIASLPSEKGMFSEGYFNYLSIYNNGLIIFSKPEPVAHATSPELFESLYTKYTGEPKPAEKKHPANTFAGVLKTYLAHNAFATRTNRNYTISNAIIPTLINAPRVDFISCNGSILAGKAIDLNTGAESIKNHVNEFWVLAEGLKEFASAHFSNPGNYELYINEPASNEHRKIVEVLHKNYPHKPFIVKELDKLELTATLLEKGNYSPFTEMLEQRNISH